jgi:hypothetical protein
LEVPAASPTCNKLLICFCFIYHEIWIGWRCHTSARDAALQISSWGVSGAWAREMPTKNFEVGGIKQRKTIFNTFEDIFIMCIEESEERVK